MGSRRFLSVLPALVALACGGSEPRFPLRDPITRDPDETPFATPPEEYVSPFAWDGANQMVFRPLSRFFAVDPAGRAVNVNAFDEVPDSSWFENRLGVHPMAPKDVQSGPCGEKVLNVEGPDGSWTIDKGKANGLNPGFRVNIEGTGKFMLKVDPPGEPDRATGATAIAARLYHAAGFFAPCDSVVYFRPSILKLLPGLTVTDNSNVTRPFDDAALKRVLDGASKRGALVRMGASRWLPGKTIGPYRYEGTRSDDPNDVIPHEDRRELRGARLLAAWLNHFDSREQNTMDVFLPVDPEKKEGPGFVRHYILDLGDCFGSVWKWDEISRRLGFAYYLDIPYLAEDFVTFGVVQRPWERVRRDAGIFNYFSERDFDPELWRGGYPNPAFVRMTESDAAWMARIIARFSDDLVAAAVQVGQYDAESTAYLTRVLVARRDAILRRYLTRLSPLSDVRVDGDRLVAVDLAVRARVRSASGAHAERWDGADAVKRTAPGPSASGDGTVVLPLEHHAPANGPADDDPSRYVVAAVWTGSAPYPVVTSLYDLGPGRGFRLVGVERPEEASPSP